MSAAPKGFEPFSLPCGFKNGYLVCVGQRIVRASGIFPRTEKVE
jgi:hypothetical protein